MGLDRIIPALLAGLAMLGLSGFPRAANAQADGNGFPSRLLAAHNLERDRAGASRLRWSSRLAQDASEWAAALAQKGRLEHADGDQRPAAGENLWMGTAGYYSAEEMIGSFVAERERFRAGTFPQVSRTGNWADVGHYTQVIWPVTQEVGCAVAKGAVNDVLVCRYFPAGNVVGQDIG